MAICIVDTGPIVSAADRKDPLRTRMQEALRSSRDRLVLPAPVTAEADYLLGARVGYESQVLFAAELARGHLHVECLEPSDYRVIAHLGRQYSHLRPGLVDLSVIVLAERLNTRRILTFDQRHFRAMTPLQGGAFVLLPWDEE